MTYQKVPALITGCLPKAALVPNPAADSARSGAGSKKTSVASEIQLDPEIRVEFSADDVDMIDEQLGNSLEGWILKNKPGTAKVGAISKAQNCKRGDPLGFFNIHCVAKY